jgi:hypothetical protein
MQAVVLNAYLSTPKAKKKTKLKPFKSPLSVLCGQSSLGCTAREVCHHMSCINHCPLHVLKKCELWKKYRSPNAHIQFDLPLSMSLSILDEGCCDNEHTMDNSDYGDDSSINQDSVYIDLLCTTSINHEQNIVCIQPPSGDSGDALFFIRILETNDKLSGRVFVQLEPTRITFIDNTESFLFYSCSCEDAREMRSIMIIGEFSELSREQFLSEFHSSLKPCIHTRIIPNARIRNIFKELLSVPSTSSSHLNFVNFEQHSHSPLLLLNRFSFTAVAVFAESVTTLFNNIELDNIRPANRAIIYRSIRDRWICNLCVRTKEHGTCDHIDEVLQWEKNNNAWITTMFPNEKRTKRRLVFDNNGDPGDYYQSDDNDSAELDTGIHLQSFTRINEIPHCPPNYNFFNYIDSVQGICMLTATVPTMHM